MGIRTGISPKSSNLENKFLLYWNGLGGPSLVPEFKFKSDRKWRSDFCHEPTKTLIEIEGGIWNGRHTRGTGFSNDCDKYLEAFLLGYSVIRLSPAQITTVNIERIIALLKTGLPLSVEKQMENGKA